jgi:hypothetical protein
MHHQTLGKPWLRRPKCKPPSFLPSFPPPRSLRFKRGRRSWPEKSHKTKGTVPLENTTTVTKHKRSFFLSDVYHQTLNLKFTIVFLLLLPHFPLSLRFFFFFLFNSYQFRQHHRRCCRGRCSWPTMSDSVVDPTNCALPIQFLVCTRVVKKEAAFCARFASSSSLCAVLHPSLIGRNLQMHAISSK